ncbi:hypothetical protein OSB04_002148 [Centaurea solstitialis]|uniref:CID domain-containing protein n=1 Tax=Centaurea solstitialis TaxID=347529 RepID=A0AA38WMG7_9ASTR|nr:hypothetical protein OSB04_002148 [Centaurea solstitialis]
MEAASFLTTRTIGFRPDSVLPLANNNTHKSLTPILDRFKGLLKEREEEVRVSAGRDDEIEIPVVNSEDIVELYEIVLSDLTINSKPLITDLTIIAGEQREHGGGIADAICARIIEVPVEQKLPSLYLLDSIVKNIGRDYVRHFSSRLPEVYCLAYRQIHPNLHPSMRHLFGTWSTVFPSSVLHKIEAQLQFSSSASYESSGLKASESPRPAHGIHVNPKYLEARRQFENSIADCKIQHARATSTSEILEQPDEIATDDSPKRVVEGTHGISNGFNVQRPRALIDAYGADERNNKTINPKLKNAKNLTTNGQKWQNTEEEEFKWEDMSPTLADRGPAIGANGSTIAKTDFSRGDWANREPVSSVAPNNAVSSSSDHGLKRKLNGFHNNPSDIPPSHRPQESWNHSHDQSWATRHHYNPHSQRPLLIDSFPGTNAQHRGLNPLSLNPMNPEVSIPSSNGAWRPSVNMQTSQPGPPFNKHITSPFEMSKTGNSAPNGNMPQMSNQHAGLVSNQQFPRPTASFPPRFSLPHEIRPNMVPPNLVSSHPTMQPMMIRGYAAPRRFDVSGGASLNPVHGMQSSVPFHGVGFPPLPPGPPPLSLAVKQIPQFPLGAANPPAGGALSGLFSSLMAQGLLSLAKPSSEQASFMYFIGLGISACVGLEFDPDVLKTRHESAITALHADLPRQCKTCGLRFKLQEEHSNHMDWHVTKNRVSRNHKQKPSRKWFPNASMWLNGTDASGADSVPGFLNPCENVVEKEDEEMAVPADEDQKACALCGEPFDDFYSDETEEWMYRGAVYMNGKTGSVLGVDRAQLGPIVHSKCRSESDVGPPDDLRNNGLVFIGERTWS